jgi:aminomethyltransferase
MSEHRHNLPLDAWHRGRGARMVPFAGYQMPIQYEGIIAEHRWTRESAGLFDVSHMGQILFTGTGLDAALEALLPADLSILKDGRLRYSLLLNEHGGILDDLMLTARAATAFLHGRERRDQARRHRTYRARLPGGVELTHMTEQALLALQGPRAVEALSRLAPGVEQLSFMTGGSFRIGGVEAGSAAPAIPARTASKSPCPRTRSATSPRHSPPSPRSSRSASARATRFGLRPACRSTDMISTRRPPRSRPISAFAISKRRRLEGGFPGAARIQLELEKGTITRRVGLRVEGRQPVREGALVVDAEGSDVGRVTSGGFSPMLEAPIAMAYVPRDMAEPGTTITLSQRAKLFQATVVPTPFVPHRYQRKGAA